MHAFINVAMDGGAPLSVGEVVGRNPAPLEGEGVRRLFETAMREHAGADFGYYERNAVAGRLREGTVRTGDIYNLESWQDVMSVVEVRGANLRDALVEELRDRGSRLDPERLYTIATTSYVAGGPASEVLGRVESRAPGALVRDATIAHLKRHGFAGGA